MTYTELFFTFLNKKIEAFEEINRERPTTAVVPLGTIECLQSDLKEYLGMDLDRDETQDYFALGLNLIESPTTIGISDILLA